VKDTIIGNSNRILEGEWIKVPTKSGVSIETPEVLRRTDLTKSLPKTDWLLLK
jgi:hypothetical protein